MAPPYDDPLSSVHCNLQPLPQDPALPAAVTVGSAGFPALGCVKWVFSDPSFAEHLGRRQLTVIA